jgi:2-polyprenyl-3-methyl-5-hydroxy-6-metoxy-1,4-benzoquinol methylase
VSDSGLHEGEIRPEALMAEQARRYAADVAWLLDRRSHFETVPCPACGAEDGDQVWGKYGLTYLRCRACESVYVSPRPTPDLLNEYYRSSTNYEYWNEVIFPASEDARREKIFRPRAERVAELAAQHGGSTRTLIDVGAGFGTFCEEVIELGVYDRVIAVEPEPHLAATCRSKGIETVEAPIELAELPDDIDAITSFEVIEHLHSPEAFLRRCAEVLAPGGLISVTCPNVKGFDVVVLGELSATVDAEHLNYLHPESLAQLLETSGFDVVERFTPGKLDAELVRKQILSGALNVDEQPFLQQVLVDDWDRVGSVFQEFLRDAGLSSNMWLTGRRG